MQQRDFIKDEIERLGRVLGKLVALVLGTEGGDLNPRQRILTAQQKLKAEVDLDPEELVRLSRADLVKKLDQLKLEPLHLDQLAEFLTIWADEEIEPEVKKILYQRVLLLYDLAGERSGTYSMIRVEKETTIRNLLK